MQDISELSNEALISILDKRVELECENEAEIIDFIREVMMRRLYVDLGADSMFDFLTRARYKYSRNIAMRKLDAARVMQTFPYIKEWIRASEVNLTQLGMFQTALRQKPATVELQAEVLEEIRNQTVESTQFILCEKLGLDIKKVTKVRIQRDGSRRMEITFSQDQWEQLIRAREILSHSVPNGDFAEVISYCAKFTADRKDPAAPLRRTGASSRGHIEEAQMSESDSDFTLAVGPTNMDRTEQVLAINQESASQAKTTPITGVPARHPRKVSRSNRRIVFQKHKGCQHRHADGTYCGSRYQLQADHVISLWAGGSNELHNLQVLCGFHNREKYRRETGANWPPPPPDDR